MSSPLRPQLRLLRFRAGLLAVAAAAVGANLMAVQANAGADLTGVVSPTAASYTPNIQAGTTDSLVCATWFTPGGCSKATVLSTTVVAGEVIVAGGFTKVNGATHDDLVAYNINTGVIDPNFAPKLNEGPAYSVVPGPTPDTVIVGGRFTSVGGATHDGLVELQVTPGVAATDGAVVSTFTGGVTGYVRSMAISSDALYIGGQFSKVDGHAENGIGRLDASTGAFDPTFGISIGQGVGALKAWGVSVSPDGSKLAVAGAFLTVGGRSDPRLGLIDTGGGLGKSATVANWTVPLLANPCSKEHDYVRDVDFSPDGSYVAIGTTGYKSQPSQSLSICDAVARIPATATASSGAVTPTWINYTGGDSAYSVNVTSAAIYFGGHYRWLNNECGSNSVCEPDAVLLMGVGAVDPNTGLAIPWWHPMSLRGQGTVSLTTVNPSSSQVGGLLVGNNVNSNGGATHEMNALYPLQGTPGGTTFGSIPSGLWALGDVGGHDEGAGGKGKPYACLTEGPAGSGYKAQLATCTNDPTQNWTDTNGVLSIGGRCLASSGTAAVVNPCDGSTGQTWTQGPGNELVNTGSGTCLTDPGSATASGTALTLTTCAQQANESWPLPAASPPPSLVPVGPISAGQTQQSSQPSCIDISSGTPKLATCIGSGKQNATINSNGTIEISGQCLDVNGTAVVADACHGAASQQWSYDLGTRRLSNAGSGKCLAINGTSDQAGDTLIVAGCTSTPVQHWRLPAV